MDGIDLSVKNPCGEIYFTSSNYLEICCVLCENSLFSSFRGFVQHLADEHQYESQNDNCAYMTPKVEWLEDEAQEKEEEEEKEDGQETDEIEIIENDSMVQETEQPIVKQDIVDGEQWLWTAQEEFLRETAVVKGEENNNQAVGYLLRANNAGEEEASLDSFDFLLKSNTHSKKNYKCGICGYAFADKSNKLAHERRHTGKKDHQCSECAKWFYTRAELRKHRHRHTGARPFMCAECGNTFVNSDALRRHMKRHSNLRDHECPHCDKRFFDSTQLRDHLVSHTRIRNFTCEICSASFLRKKNLIVHMKIHANKREYVCHICQAAYNQKPALFMHMKKHGESLHKSN